MKRINLIPASRIDAKRRRNNARRCIAGCTIYATLVLVAAMAFRFSRPDERESAEQQLAGADAIVQHARTTLTVTRTELARANITLGVNRTLANQPDWSQLLALVARLNSDQIVLKSCALSTRTEMQKPMAIVPVVQTMAQSAKPAQLPPAIETVLTLTGTGESQLAVTQYVVRLEKTNLFRRVTMLESGREAFLGVDAAKFRIECILHTEDK